MAEKSLGDAFRQEAVPLTVKPTVAICAKCGRGFPRHHVFDKNGKFIRSGPPVEFTVDSQPIWWTKTHEGPRCDGAIMHVDRMKQIERVFEPPIVDPNDVTVLF